MKRILGILLSVVLLLTDTVGIFASQVEDCETTKKPGNQMFSTGLLELEAVDLSEIGKDADVCDYKEITDIHKFSTVYDDEWDKYSTNYFYNRLSAEWKEWWDAMDAVCLTYLNQPLDTENGIIVEMSLPYSVSMEELQALLMIYMCSNPQYYFLSNRYGCSRNGWGEATSLVLFSYDAFCDGTARMAATRAVERQVNAWQALVETYTTEEEKVKTIHDLICNKVDYNYDFVNEKVDEEDAFTQSAYSVFCTDLTVCAGYSDAMAMMCNGAGIDAVSVTSWNHQWNKIRINDSWYNYDLTWDDQGDDKIFYEFYARNDAYYDTAQQADSHAEESFWNDYLPKCTLDAEPSHDGMIPGDYPTIVNQTASPEIMTKTIGGKNVVTITSDTPNAEIYYTLDGTQPSVAFTKAFRYKEPLQIAETCEVKAIAVCDTCFDSSVTSLVLETVVETYTITYVLNGGRNHSNNPITYKSNTEPFYLYSASRDGYIFDGWYLDSYFKRGIRGIDGSMGSITVYAKWEEAHVSLKDAVVTLSQTVFTYDGKEKKPNVYLTLGNRSLVYGTDFTVSYQNHINTGTGTVTITGIGRYDGVLERSFTIQPVDISYAVIGLSKTSYTYNKKVRKPSVSAVFGESVLKKDVDYIVSYKNNKNIGTAVVVIEGRGNYKGTVKKSFTIKAEKGTAFTSGANKYKVTSSSTVAFVGIKNTKTTKVSIPGTVKYGGKIFKVTSIGEKALKNKTKITSVTIGDNIETIGTAAFTGCKKLSKVIIGSKVKTIKQKAFLNCSALKSITIKSKVLKKVEKQTFQGIYAKAKIRVPKSQWTSYKKLLKGKGMGNRVRIVK